MRTRRPPRSPCTDDGTFDLRLTIGDGVNPAVTATTTVTVGNVAPTLAVTAPVDGAVVPAGSAVNLVAAFGDAGGNDPTGSSCSVNWDDGTAATPATVSAGDCSASRTFAAPGVYMIGVTLDDQDGGTATDSAMVVVYDPSAGFVTGGGWSASPAGAYRADPSLSGKANFGFVSKYKKGAATPTGETEFQFSAGSFNFHSGACEWLVVAGARAQYKGTGAVNGVAGYSFLLTATDGQVAGGGGVDRFRIKVWAASGEIVYDNALGAPDDLESASPQALGGGSISIKK